MKFFLPMVNIELGEIKINDDGTKLYYSTYYKEYVRDYQFCSEHFVCNGCLRDNNKIIKGFKRWDSLVLCQKHAESFQPTINKLYEVLENNPNVTIIKDLGL